MESIPKNAILEFLPDTLMSVRREYDLDKPGRMEEAIRILREWVEKQPHFRKKDFSDRYLEFTIVSCKGLLERAKRQLDRMCTFRTLLPQFLGPRNAKTDFKVLLDAVTPVLLPKMLPNHYRVFLVKATDQTQKIQNCLDYFRLNFILSEYIKRYDYMYGICIILDATEADMVDILSKVNITDMRQGLSILSEGFGARMCGIHLFTTSKFVDAAVAVIKKVVSPKIAERIYTYNNLDALPSIVPIDILPKDYGGKERPLAQISREWIDELSSEDHIQYLRDMEGACTDESYRQKSDFNNQYAGMPGTFRLLTVD